MLNLQKARVVHLLSEDRASKDGVVSAAWTQVDLNGKLILGAPNAGDLTLMHHLLEEVNSSLTKFHNRQCNRSVAFTITELRS